MGDEKILREKVWEKFDFEKNMEKFKLSGKMAAICFWIVMKLFKKTVNSKLKKKVKGCFFF